MIKSIHKTVLLNEAIEGLNLSEKSVVIDATFGGGGHSRKICEKYPSVKIIGIDQDEGALERGRELMKGCDITFLHRNFRELGDLAADAIIFDLGLSSDQLDNSGRGFSFMRDEPLMMTMKENPLPEDLTAYDVVNTWGEENLAKIIFGYGEEKLSRKIARAIVDARERAEIKTTFDLVKVIESAVGKAYKRQKIHPATRTFQALRIATNDELGALSAGLQTGFDILNTGGRMSVISFHSLEDRIVKKFFKTKADTGEAILINKKVILAGSEEIKNNSRARSAKLRIIEKKSPPGRDK